MKNPSLRVNWSILLLWRRTVLRPVDKWAPGASRVFLVRTVSKAGGLLQKAEAGCTPAWQGTN